MKTRPASPSRYRSFKTMGSILGAALLCAASARPVGSAALEETDAVVSLTLSPATIAGGSGGTSTGTFTLDGPAPPGGAVVTLASSNVELAATLPRITVPEGETTATFTVATNAGYRRYSGLGFSVTISATHVTTRSATLSVTAQPRPADFTSGSQAGSNTQWDGLMCGGIAPIGGYQGILYDCSPATGTGFGSCTFRQECSLGCRRVPPNGGTFNDFCATSGPNSVAISRNYIASGDRVPAAIVAEAPAGQAQDREQGVPGVVDPSFNSIHFPQVGIEFPIGATSVPFEVATSYVPEIQFVDVEGFWFNASIPPFLITNGRAGHAWLVMTPPDPPPAVAIPTLGDFKITGLNPVTGGESTFGQIDISGLSRVGGPTVTLTSSDAGIVPSTSIEAPANENVFGFQVPIATNAPAADTDVTITATDGRYSFSAVLTVRVPPPPPALSGVSVNPTSVRGGSSATGTVTLSAPQSGATVIALSTPAPASVAAMPASVTVPAGATIANFTINTSSVTSQFNMNIFADLAGSPGRQALLLITPGGSTTLGSLAINPVDIVGSTSTTGTVTLTGAAPSGGAVVTLSKALSNGGTGTVPVTIPASVTVPAGQTTASFTIATSSVTATTVVRISAVFNGVTVNADMTLFTRLGQVSFSGNVPGGNSATGTVTLNAAAPSGGAVVSLSSANTSLVTVPPSVTVPAGQTTATFTANTAPVTATTPVVISASHAGATVSTTLFLVVSRAVSSVTLNPSSVAGGVSAIGTVTLRAAAPTGNAVVALASSNSIFAVVPNSVVVPAGQTSATFTVNTAQVTATTTVVISASYENVTQSATLTINPSGSTATLSAVSLNPTSVVGGNASTGTVTLSAAAPTGGAAVSLSDDSPAATAPASVTVPAGSTSATFTVTTSSVAASTSATISAVHAGVTRTATLTVNPSTPSAPSLVSPSNGATVAQPVTLVWSNVSGAASYEVQVDSSSTIAAPFTANPTVTVSQVTLSGLPAQRLWWRVRARNAAGVFGPFSSTRRFTPQAASATATLSSAGVNPTSVVGGSGSTGTVTLTSGAPTGGAVVSLSSSNAGAAGVPASVTVAASATSATFAATTSAVTASTSVTVTATYSGTSRTATLTVTPAPPPASLQSVSVNPSSVTGGTTSQGSVTLSSGAPAGGIVVSLSSGNTAAAGVPATATVAAGATSASFTATTSGVAASTPVTITAAHNGVTRTATLTVNPPGQAATLTVTATGRGGERVSSSPAGISVNVGSTGSALFAVGTSITLSVTNGRDAVWSGACSSGGSKTRSCTFTLAGTASVTANVQ